MNPLPIRLDLLPSCEGLQRRSRGAVRVLWLVAYLAGMAAPSARGQSLPVGDVVEEYLRVLQVAGIATAGSFQVRPFPIWSGLPVADSITHPWAEVVGSASPEPSPSSFRAILDPAQIRVFGNSKIPFGQNDGAVWQGRGLTVVLDAGGSFAWGPPRLTLHPVLVYAQNQSFPLAPVGREGAGEYAYPWRPIDLPQRFGPDSHVALDPGQSTLRANWRGVTVGFGTESLWWGPGIQNSILMSNNAPGFPHGFLGTSRPVSVGIGTVEAQWIWGRLQGSNWYPEADSGQGRFITGAAVSFSPSFLEGLSVGAARVFLTNVPSDGLDAGEYFTVLQLGSKSQLATPENPTGNDERDQIVSLLVRWVSPASGYEVYAEWARNDQFWDLRDLVTEPEHSQAYTLGFQKVIALSRGRLLALAWELTHLERSRTFLVRDAPTYYAHHLVRRGYTQRGQIIGAAVGPGGDGQYLGADLYGPSGRWGVFARRRVHDNDAYFDWAVANDAGPCCHHVALSVGSRVLVFAGGLELEFDAVFTRELNRYFQQGNDVTNAHAGVAVRWRPR